MLASLGATEKDVRFVLVVDGLAPAWRARPSAPPSRRAPGSGTSRTWRRPPRTAPTPWPPWAAVIIGLLLAVATSVIAAVWPGRAVSKMPVVVAALRAGSSRRRLVNALAAARSNLPGRGPVHAVLLRRPERRRRQQQLPRHRRADLLRDRLGAARPVHRRPALPAGLARPAGDHGSPPRPGALPVAVRRGDRGGLVRGLPRHDRDRHRQHPVRRRARLHRAEHGGRTSSSSTPPSTTLPSTRRGSSPPPPRWPRSAPGRPPWPSSCTRPPRSSSTCQSASTCASPGSPPRISTAASCRRATAAASSAG